MLIFVFRHSPKTPFSLLQKHRKYHCFGFILGFRGRENIARTVVLSSVGVQNTVNNDVLGTVLNASFRTPQAKNIVKYSVFAFSLSLSAKRLNPKAQTPVSQKLSNPADLRLFSRQHEKESKVQNKWLNHLSS